MKPLYVMLIGLPGSGKSTLAHEIMERLPERNWHLVSSDDYIDRIAAERGSTYDAVFKDTIDAATKDMNERRQVALNERRNIIHDQTNLTAKSRARKFASVPNDYLRVGILCEVSPEERARRMAERPGKAIPADVDARMVTELQAPTLTEFTEIGLTDNWVDLLGRAP